MQSKYEIKRVAVDGINVAFTQIGCGAKNAVVCQGWGTNFKLYETIANALFDTYRVTLFDFPGFGLTPEPSHSWSVKQYCDFLHKFLSALEIDKAVLIGHSFGGRVIIELESDEDKSVVADKIVLVDSAGIMPKRSTGQILKSRFFKLKRTCLTSKLIHPLFPEVIDDWLSRQGSEDYRAATPLMKQVLVKAVNYDQTDLLCNIDVPTLLIWGENDDATPLEDGKIMEEKIAGAGLVVIKDCGHYSFIEKQAQFNSVLRSFL